MNTAVFIAFIEKAESIPFIVGSFALARTFSTEKDKKIIVRIKLKAVLDDVDQTA